jgi:hypothetical protein
VSEPTSGKWTADLHHTRNYAGRSHGFVRAEGHLVPLAVVVLAAEGCDEAEGRANAVLFAASKDLLAALKRFVALTDGVDDEWNRFELCDAHDQAHAIIADLEKETP